MGSCAGKGLKNEMKEINDNYIYLPKSINTTKQFRELYVGSENDKTDDESKQQRNNRFSCLLNSNYRRDSFDRFGDDFTELILSFLNLEDKMRFECLNRQWNRCIFNKVVDIDYPLKKVFPWNFDIKKKMLISKIFIKKCRFIRKLRLHSVLDNGLLKLISENCKYVEDIGFRSENLKPIKREILYSFAQNCGPKIKTIKILELCEDSFNTESGLSLLIVYSEYFTNVRNISISLDSNMCLKYFNLFTELFYYQIKSLSLRIKLSSNYTQLDETFEQLQNFVNLENIDLIIESETTLKLDLEEGVKQLAKNCLKLKNICLEFNGNFNSSTDILKSLETFSDINSLKIINRSKDLLLGSFISLEKFKNLNNLYVLYGKLNDETFYSIHKYCEKLKSIEIWALNELTDKTLNSLSKIPDIIKIKISGVPYKVYDITDSGVCHILNNCNKLKILELNCGIKITKETFETLSILGKTRPENRLRFKFFWKRSEKHNRETFTMRSYPDEFPLVYSNDETEPELSTLSTNIDLPQNIQLESNEYVVHWCGTAMMHEIYCYRKLFNEDNYFD